MFIEWKDLHVRIETPTARNAGGEYTLNSNTDTTCRQNGVADQMLHIYQVNALFNFCLFYTVLKIERGNRGIYRDNYHHFPYKKGAPIAQWVKRWPTDLPVPSASPARCEIF